MMIRETNQRRNEINCFLLLLLKLTVVNSLSLTLDWYNLYFRRNLPVFSDVIVVDPVLHQGDESIRNRGALRQLKLGLHSEERGTLLEVEVQLQHCEQFGFLCTLSMHWYFSN